MLTLSHVLIIVIRQLLHLTIFIIHNSVIDNNYEITQMLGCGLTIHVDKLHIPFTVVIL